MCKAFSCLFMENGEVVWKFGTDSHEDLIASLKLPDDGRNQKFVRIEIAPRNGSYLEPDYWDFRVDQEDTPKWFREKYAEKMCRKSLKEWGDSLSEILVRKGAVNPLLIRRRLLPTKREISLFESWVSVMDSVGTMVVASAGDSVWASVDTAVGASVGKSVWDSVWKSVWALVGGSVGGSVETSVGASVGKSVWDSFWAYIGSFFNLPRNAWEYTNKIPGKKYPFQPCVDLWERGLVPSFDGKTWRLHAGKDAKIVHEWTPGKKE